jgi:hypothetical protein
MFEQGHFAVIEHHEQFFTFWRAQSGLPSLVQQVPSDSPQCLSPASSCSVREESPSPKQLELGDDYADLGALLFGLALAGGSA